jgi:glycosyltransferase involved in cell wall biosynthesis
LRPTDFAIIIPVFNHEQRVKEVILQALALEIPIYVVDDGSTDRTSEIVDSISGITVLRHKLNLGKGAALLSGFAAAAKKSKWAISIDADGQHNPVDALKLIQAIPTAQRCLIVGKREGMGGINVPWTSKFGRKFSNFWVWVSGGPLLMDSQSGFRVYPLPESLSLGVKSRRFQFEVEVIVKAKQQHIPVYEAPIQVVYQKGSARVSHFHPWKDFLRNSATFSRLIINRIFKGLCRFGHSLFIIKGK